MPVLVIFKFDEDSIKHEVAIVFTTLFFLHATHLLDLIYVPIKNYKLSQIVWELWPAQDFSIWGDKYIVDKRTMMVLYRSPDQTDLHIYC